MGNVKKFGFSLVGLLFGLIALMVVLNLLKKAPVVGGIAEKAQELATSGTM